MIVDHPQSDLDRQLERLGAHRQERVQPVPALAVPAAAPSGPSRLPVLAAAATALVLFASGAFLLLRAGAEEATVDTAGGGAIDSSSEPVGDGPAASDPAGGADSTGPGLFSELFDRPESDEAEGIDDDPLPDDASSSDEPSALPADRDPEDLPGDSGGSDGDALPEMDEAGEALADLSATVIGVTRGLAKAGAASSADRTGSADGQGQQEDLATEVAVGAAGDGSCATSKLEADLSISIRFTDCPAEDGRRVNGLVTAWIERWIPFELGVVTAGLEIGDDRLWLDATLGFPSSGPGRTVPVLSGEALLEGGGDVAHLEGSLRFQPGRVVLDGKLGHVSDTALIGDDRVTYRLGQTIVTATSTALTVAEGSCAPSAGTTEYRVYTVAGIRGGGSETEDLERVEVDEQLAADVLYRSTTPADGRVDLRLDGQLIDHRLQAPCP